MKDVSVVSKNTEAAILGPCKIVSLVKTPTEEKANESVANVGKGRPFDNEA